MTSNNYIIDCRYITEWDGEIDRVESQANLDVTTGIIGNTDRNTVVNVDELGPLIGHYTEFTFCNKDYRLYLIPTPSGYRVQQLENLAPIVSMLQLQNELPVNNIKAKRNKI